MKLEKSNKKIGLILRKKSEKFQKAIPEKNSGQTDKTEKWTNVQRVFYRTFTSLVQ